LRALERFQNCLDTVDGGQNKRHRFARRRSTVAKLAHERLGCVSKRLQTWQAEKAASAFDRVDEAENIIENLGVVWILFETHELDVDHVETFVRLGDKFPQQVVHKKRSPTGIGPFTAFRRKRGQCVDEAFNFGCAAATRSRPLTAH
jgi:hypothetical protein